jgi:HEAT repeat protein
VGDAAALNDEKAIPHLMKLAVKDPAQSVREIAIAALAQYDHPQIGAYLRQLTQEPNQSEFVRESIAEQLASYDGSETITALNKLLLDESPIVI